MRHILAFALSAAFITTTTSCDMPCRDRNLVLIGTGGPVGAVIAALGQCRDDAETTPPTQAGPELPDMATPPPPDMAAPPADMAHAAPDQFCDPDADADGVPDRIDRCPTLSGKKTPDPDRSGCPAPRSYQIELYPAAFSAAGSVEVLNGIVTSKAANGFNWATMAWQPAALTAVFFFQNSSANASNAVSFELNGMADFTAPATRIDTCAVFRDNAHQDASMANPAMGNPNSVVCLARRIMLCPVDTATPTSISFGEKECVRVISGGGGFWSAANGPLKLAANVDSADWISSEPRPVASIELQILMAGNVTLAGWSVVATVTETLH